MDFLFRLAILGLGYVYPAYKCFKVIDCGKKPKSEELYTWCQYWIIIAVFTGCERVADTFISWLPFYSGAKLAFVVYLWHPDTKGTEYVYQTFLKPVVSKHTESVDFNLGLLRDETMRVLGIFWTRLMHQLQSKASQMLHQDVVESGPIQDYVPVYPPVPASIYSWSTMQQQRQPFYPGHQPLITKSVIWPDEEHKQEPLSSSHPRRALMHLRKGQQNQLGQLLNHHTQTDTKVHDSGASMATSGPPNTEEHKVTGAEKEETDFELVHPNEVPKLGSSGAAAFHKSQISAPGARFRWWW
ncbi:hypothetical protein GOP47_0015878 [Adiantum capillus-veneris]|uniref:HVA22-like protein n=1 Tax=Adiantum capillus-veneris TaxID=13818 RepID=A0A9D4ZD09_ADICA|nr:hypothetical protein GOP47_0015878 [Adiantum capillus-veneris]